MKLKIARPLFLNLPRAIGGFFYLEKGGVTDGQQPKQQLVRAPETGLFS